MYKKLCVVALSCLFTTQAIAVQESDSITLSPQLNKSYQTLKSKTQQGKQVSVIARLKPSQESTYVYRSAEFAKQAQMQPRISEASSELQMLGVNVNRSFSRWGYITMEVSDIELDAVMSSGLFDMVSENIPLTANIAESSQHINAPQTFDMGYTGAGQTVVIFDSGIEVDHPFLGGRVIQEACFSSNTPNHNTSLCPNGATSLVGPGAASFCENRDLDVCRHGTHVAGIAAGDFSVSIRGIAPDANIVGVQVFTQIEDTATCGNENPCMSAYSSELLAAFNWVLDEIERGALNNVAALNLSLGGGEFDTACDDDILAQPIEDLRRMGIATVIAAGNEYLNRAVSYPGCISDAITVGGTLRTDDSLIIVRDPAGNIRWGTNMSEQVDLLAPGLNITSSVPGPAFASSSGTSMSAPHVAGAIAVLKQINPDASVARIQQVLELTGVNVTDERNNITRPRIDLHAAALSLEAKPIAALDQPSYSVKVGTQHTFTANSSSDPNGRTLSYGWDFDGDGVVDEETSSPVVQHTYHNMGSYQLQLTVSNNEKSQTTQASVTAYDPVIISIIVNSILD
ncbi:S8 family serine peptidase [Pseudoalteromonas sp. OOF1S-7]|uniref:S8 family peptidase n=1 Tax=Pseudoalteromonas sp. OOF1S-7 TaxID=2917757 RepID=UPI001EF579BD|nr:S8 family serine peptidase [Pseudoalteromonas sp. OOF1S-7]MCG7537382.1 S8 family serine peptidase [Pseudoalteromonas sp. OOF1S-7]